MLDRFGSFIKVDEDDWLDVSGVLRVGCCQIYGGNYRVVIESHTGSLHNAKSDLSKKDAEALRDQLLEQIVKIRSEVKHGF